MNKMKSTRLRPLIIFNMLLLFILCISSTCIAQTTNKHSTNKPSSVYAYSSILQKLDEDSLLSKQFLYKSPLKTGSLKSDLMNKTVNTGDNLYTANELYKGRDTYVASLYKNKSQANCNAPPATLIAGVYTYQNKKQCSYTSQLPEYRVPISKPAPYRYYQSNVFPTGHFTQKPRTYPNPSRLKNP